MIKRIMLCLAMTGLTTLAVAATAQPKESPEQTLRSTVDHLQQLIRENHREYKADPEKFYRVVNDVVVPRFDVPYISQLVLARYWRTASPAQRKAFEDSFKDMLIRSYADALLDNYDSTKVEWKPERIDPHATRARVDTVLVRNNGQNYPISFSLHVVDGQWKIYDITVNNLSLALNFRSQIVGEVKRIGLDAVIKKMQRGDFTKPKESR